MKFFIFTIVLGLSATLIASHSYASDDQASIISDGNISCHMQSPAPHANWACEISPGSDVQITNSRPAPTNIYTSVETKEICSADVDAKVVCGGVLLAGNVYSTVLVHFNGTFVLQCGFNGGDLLHSTCLTYDTATIGTSRAQPLPSHRPLTPAEGFGCIYGTSFGIYCD